MTIKEKIYNFVKSQNKPVTRKEIVNFYCDLTNKTPKDCNNLSEALCNPNCNHGYLMTGKFALTKIARNQYIA